MKPFLPGETTLLGAEEPEGSECDFESVARNNAYKGKHWDYKFRVRIQVGTVEPDKADVVAQRKDYETSKYNGDLSNHKVAEIPRIADGAFGAFDSYGMFTLYSIFKPDVLMEVNVFRVAEQQAPELAKSIAQILEKHLREEGVAAKVR